MSASSPVIRIIITFHDVNRRLWIFIGSRYSQIIHENSEYPHSKSHWKGREIERDKTKSLHMPPQISQKSENDGISDENWRSAIFYIMNALSRIYFWRGYVKSTLWAIISFQLYSSMQVRLKLIFGAWFQANK